MKKSISFIAVLLFSLSAFAGNPLKLIGGDKKFFKSAQGDAVLEISFEGASYDGKMPLSEKYSDIPSKVKVCYDGFVEEFVERNQNVRIVSVADQAKYRITVNVTKVDEFVNIMGFIPGPCIRVWGTLTITDISSGDSLLSVAIDEIDGGSAPHVDRAFNDTFGELAKRISKFK